MDTEPGRRTAGNSLSRWILGVSLLVTPVAGAGELPRYDVFIGGVQVSPEIVDGTINMKRGESRIFHGGMGREGEERAADAAIAALVGRELLVRAAGERGIGVTGKEIQDYAEGKARAFGGKEKFTKYLESTGVPWGVYVKIAGDSLLASRYVERTIEPGIQVGEEEIRDYYRENRGMFEEPSLKTFDQLLVIMKGGEPSPEVESLFPPAGVPFAPSKTLQAYHRALAERGIPANADISRLDGVKVRESSAPLLWKQLDGAGPGMGILLRYPERGRMVYQCVYVVGLEEGKKVSLQEATPSIRAKLRALRKEKAILEEVEALKKRYPVEIRRKEG